MVAPVRFCRTRDAIQIAYRTAGSGPPLVFPAWWFTHQEVLWEIPAVRAFFTSLAESFTVVTYDKPGCGLSDRDRPAFALDEQLAALNAVIDTLKLERLALFGFSMAGPAAIAYAAHNPERVDHLVLLSTSAHTPPANPTRDPAMWEASKALMRAHWGLGSSAVVQTSAPDAGGDLRDWMARHMCEAVDPDTAIAMVERFPAIDVTDLLPRVQAPTLVLHRKDDASFPFARGRELAAAIPGARFISLDGSWHAFYEHEVQDVVLLALAHVNSEGTYPPPADGRGAVADGLSRREIEVLRLMAVGRRNREIAAQLSISENTVFQHVRSIFNKTGCANRTEAAAYALRHGLVE